MHAITWRGRAVTPEAEESLPTNCGSASAQRIGSWWLVNHRRTPATTIIYSYRCSCRPEENFWVLWRAEINALSDAGLTGQNGRIVIEAAQTERRRPLDVAFRLPAGKPAAFPD